MNHQSFRLFPNARRARITPRLRLIFACVYIVYILLGLGVLGIAAIVGASTEFFVEDEPNWIVLISFSVLVVLAIQSIQTSVFANAKRVSSKYLVDRWMTAEQADQFPGWYDRWPECWYESGDANQAQR